MMKKKKFYKIDLRMSRFDDRSSKLTFDTQANFYRNLQGNQS